MRGWGVSTPVVLRLVHACSATRYFVEWQNHTTLYHPLMLNDTLQPPLPPAVLSLHWGGVWELMAATIKCVDKGLPVVDH